MGGVRMRAARRQIFGAFRVVRLGLGSGEVRRAPRWWPRDL